LFAAGVTAGKTTRTAQLRFSPYVRYRRRQPHCFHPPARVRIPSHAGRRAYVRWCHAANEVQVPRDNPSIAAGGETLRSGEKCQKVVTDSRSPYNPVRPVDTEVLHSATARPRICDRRDDMEARREVRVEKVSERARKGRRAQARTAGVVVEELVVEMGRREWLWAKRDRSR